ncbi:MAG: PspC domain-containing protein [Cyanobacteria bacterium J06635_1]
MPALIWPTLLLILGFMGPAISAIAIRQSLSIRRQILLLIACTLYGIGPLLLAFGALGLAGVLNCHPQTSAISCPNQPWLSDWLSFATVGHWFTMITLPSAIFGDLGLLGSISYRVKNPGSTVMFYRSRRRGLIGGVCAGIAQRTQLPLMVVRMVVVALLLMTSVLTLIAYGWAWMAFPREPITAKKIRPRQPGAKSEIPYLD